MIAQPTIHVIGDSHASFNFRPPNHSLCEHDRFTYYDNDLHLSLPFEIRWLGAITMHRVGRDTLACVNIRNYGVKEHDVVVFVFGEIDIRCHIGKQRDQSGRDLIEVITTLANNYCSSIVANKNLFHNVYCIALSPLPPIDGKERECAAFPIYGPLEDRVSIHKMLIRQLEISCKEHNIGFCDISNFFSKSDGSLDETKADDRVHVNPAFNDPIKKTVIAHLDLYSSSLLKQ